MFQSARLKLTAWYLVLILLISASFSLGFYNIASRELDSIMFRQKFRLERSRFSPFEAQFIPQILENIEELQQTQERLKYVLVGVNAFIVITSGILGYILAGRTLRPIQNMVNEQNRFITDASHELRTPLTALRTELETTLLEDNISTEDSKKILTSNLEEVINLQSLADNLLKLAQFNTNHKKIMRDKIIMTDLVDEAIKKVSPLAKKKEISIQNITDSEELQGDKSSLTQLLIILLDNAIKYSGSGTQIKLASAKIDHTVKISVTDQGIGMTEDEQKHIFDRFYRADKSRTKTDTPGYGLGLAIAKKIIQEHNGSISIKSAPEKGTTFTVSLPSN